MLWTPPPDARVLSIWEPLEHPKITINQGLFAALHESESESESGPFAKGNPEDMCSC
jgi:hypothetical protein